MTPDQRDPTTWARVRLAAGALVLLVVGWRIGTGPFLDGLRLTSPMALLAATCVTALTTLCCAWRWQLVAGRLGLTIGLPAAVAAVYRAQFLNATLPGGVLGDVDRAVGHGLGTDALGPAVRSVVWERTLGQVVQVALTVAVVLLAPSPLQPVGAWAVVAALALTAVVLCVRSPGQRLPARLRRAATADLREILRPVPARVGIALASALAVSGHLVVFLVAVHVAGVGAPAHVLVPLGAVVLLAAGLPLNVAGWGPREGAAAWAFGTVGLGLDAGVTTAVVYGVMALVATLPGAVVLLRGRRSSHAARPTPERTRVLDGAARG